EQIAKDLGPAADHAEHARLWAEAVRVWLQEALDSMPEEEVDLSRHVRHLLDDRPPTDADFLTWRELRVHARRRPASLSALAADPSHPPPPSRARGEMIEISKVAETGMKLEPFVISPKAKGTTGERAAPVHPPPPPLPVEPPPPSHGEPPPSLAGHPPP